MPLPPADRVMGEDGLLALHYLVAGKRLAHAA
jgi:hypothetical protein